MAQQLWMLRHGEAVPHDSKPDAERELTPRGRRQAEAAGGALAALSEEFAACYTSPKVRARETAALASAHLNIEPISEDSLADGFSRVDALTLLDAHDADAHLLVVGHEPAFSQVEPRLCQSDRSPDSWSVHHRMSGSAPRSTGDGAQPAATSPAASAATTASSLAPYSRSGCIRGPHALPAHPRASRDR